MELPETTSQEQWLKKYFTMKNNSEFPLLLIISMFLMRVPTGAAQPPATNMSQSLESIRKKHELPALAAVVVKDGQIQERAAVGVRKWGVATPVTTRDLWHIGSCTKAMTATLAAILVEEGKLRWNTTIGDVFPELKDRMDTQYQAVTLEQLLQNRGGIAGAPPGPAWKRAWEESGTPTQQRLEFIKTVLSHPPEAPPGTKMIYSNQGFVIAGAMMEKLTGTAYEKLMTDRLFKPLGMTTAGFGTPGSRGKTDQPWGHVKRTGTTVPTQSDNPPAIGPAGRVYCSLDDMARFTMLHLESSTTKQLLSHETLRRLHTPPAGGDYAAGWFVVKRGWARGTAITHNGSNNMWYIVMWLAPERDFAVIAATNIAGSAAETGCDEVASAMIGKWLAK